MPSKNLNDVASRYLSAGLNPVPLNRGSKEPNRKKWTDPIQEADIEKFTFEEIGVCTGIVSGGLEVIDFDLDVLDDPEEVWMKWKSSVPNSVLRKVVVAQTKSGGYHVIYRCSDIAGNLKLAYHHKGNEKYEIMIETRGEGGYIKCAPSEGYKVIYGDLEEVNIIQPWERNALIAAAKKFDQKIKTKNRKSKDFVDPFPKYNEDEEIGLDILAKHGWETLQEKDEWVELMRPGKRNVGISAGYNLDGKFLFVWSTNTEFETEKPYSNVGIYAMLEHDGDFSKAYKQLKRDGWGTTQKKEKPKKKVQKVEEEVEEEDGDLGFISFQGEDEAKLFAAIKGDVEVGESFGWPALDPYLLYKENSLNFVLAYEGVGKTYMVLHKLAAMAVTKGKKFGISCGENEVWTVKRNLIEAISGKRIDYFNSPKHKKEFEVYRDFMYAHFYIFKNDHHYTIEEVLERATTLSAHYRLDGVFIDPFSYYKRPLNNSYQYIDNLLSELNIFAKKEMGVWMSLHPNSEATRKPRDAEGYLKPPTRYDAIGGNIFANRCDHFIVYHRIKNHKIKEFRFIMEIRVEKVKDYDTGGSETPANESVSLKYKNFRGWRGYFDDQNNNPICDINGVPYEAPAKEKPLPRGRVEDAF